MVTRNVSFAVGEFYHVYNRGVDKRDIYTTHADHERFQELLFLSNSSDAVNVRDTRRILGSVYEHERSSAQVAIGSYCLMPNHFHILLTPLTDTGISTFMNKLTTSYSMYFNKRHDRSGSLFEGRYKARHVESDQYLKYLFAYIHLNPVKLIEPSWKERGILDAATAFKYLQEYRYSSFQDYQNMKRKEEAILSPSRFPIYFADALDHKKELLDWLSFGEVIENSP